MQRTKNRDKGRQRNNFTFSMNIHVRVFYYYALKQTCLGIILCFIICLTIYNKVLILEEFEACYVHPSHGKCVSLQITIFLWVTCPSIFSARRTVFALRSSLSSICLALFQTCLLSLRVSAQGGILMSQGLSHKPKSAKALSVDQGEVLHYLSLLGVG